MIIDGLYCRMALGVSSLVYKPEQGEVLTRALTGGPPPGAGAGRVMNGQEILEPQQ